METKRNRKTFRLILLIALVIPSGIFAQLFGGQIKSKKVLIPEYPVGIVFCNSIPTTVIEVTNPTTGRIWMDRNLGASQVATASNDANSYGDLYQWGRRADGHQCRNSAWTSTLSSSDQPAHGIFIIPCDPAQCGSGGTGIIMNPTGQPPFDWRNPQNSNLWQGINGVNNPCPTGFRLPSEAEFSSERLSWSSPDGVGALASPLKLPQSGGRNLGGPSNTFSGVDTYGYYWVSTFTTQNARALRFRFSYSDFIEQYRSTGFAVRCIKD
jgi:hypothetical protein